MTTRRRAARAPRRRAADAGRRGRRRRSCAPASRRAGKTDAAGADPAGEGASWIATRPTARPTEDCQGTLTVELIDLGGRRRQVGHRPHQHPGAVSREGRRRRHRPGGAAAADGRAQQRSADPPGPRVEHLAPAPGPRARAPQRDALRRRALRAGRAARRIVRHAAGRRAHRAARGERAARRRAARRRVQSRRRAPITCTCARSSTRRSRRALYASPGREHVAVRERAAGPRRTYRFEGPATFDGPGATGTASSSGLSLGLRGGVETLRTADVRMLAFLQVTLPAFVSDDPDHGVVDQWVPSAALGAGVLY